jgi:serine/threonine protein phosphatase PrpC
MLCSDGLWSGVPDEGLASLSTSPKEHLREALAALGEQAVSNSAPYADNTSAAAIRWLGP